MSAVLKMLTENGLMLLEGVTAWLLAGSLAAMVIRSPVHRQRVCELSVLAALAWIVLAIIPMPRFALKTKGVGSVPLVHVDPTPAPAPIEIPPELIAKPQSGKLAKQDASIARAIAAIPERRIDVAAMLSRAYLAGAAACGAWLVLGHLLLWRMIRRSRAVPEQVLPMIGWRRPRPRVMVSPGLARPVTCGVIRPTILLPPVLLNQERALQLRQTLLHELGHIQQRDAVGSLLINLALPLLYFHPLYWLLRRRAHLSRELVVDDLASRIDGKEAYVEQLLEMARGRLTTGINPVGSIGILQVRSLFYRRIHMLLERRQPLATRCSTPCRLVMTAIIITAVMMSASLIGVRPASAQDAPAGPAAKDKPREDQAAKDRTAIQVQKEIDQLVDRMKVIEERLALLKKAQAQMSGAKGMDPAIEAAVRTRDPVLIIDELTEAQIGTLDPNLHKMLAERAAMLSEIARQEATGALPENVNLLKLKAAQADEQKKIEAYVLQWRDMQKKMAKNGTPGALLRAPDAKTNASTADASQIGGVQLDVVQLGNSLVDASGTLQIAQVKFQMLDHLRKDGAQNGEEWMTARVNFDTAKKRLALLRGIAQIALQTAQENLNIANARIKQGLQTTESLSDAKSKVQMLEVILKAAE